MQDDVDGVGSVVIPGVVSARRCHAHHGKKESPPCPGPLDPLRFDHEGGTCQPRASVRCLALCRFAERRRAALPPCGVVRPVRPLGGPFRRARLRTLAMRRRWSAIWHARVVVPLLVTVAPLSLPSLSFGCLGASCPVGPRRACGVGAHGPGAVCVTARIVTWLILPVVICLSQRLSHACVSINSLVL